MYKRELRIRQINDMADPRWLEMLRSHPDARVYHHPLWLEVLHRAYGYEALSLACEDAEGRLCGVLPMMHTDGLLSGRGLTSLPRTLVAGPLATTREARNALVEAAVDLVRSDTNCRLQLRIYAADDDSLVRNMPRYPTYVLNLSQTPDQIRFGSGRNHARIAYAARRATRMGVVVRVADKESDLKRWYRLYLETMRWHISPPHPYDEYKAWWDILWPRGLMRLVVVELHEEVGSPRLIGGSIFLTCGLTTLDAVNARSMADLGYRPNDALHWWAIHQAHEDGIKYYDFGGVPGENEGLKHFKQKWGAELKPLYYFYSPALAAETRSHTGSPSPVGKLKGEATKAVNLAWRHLPLGMTAHLGAWMHRHL